jgi:hypothetical protein
MFARRYVRFRNHSGTVNAGALALVTQKRSSMNGGLDSLFRLQDDVAAEADAAAMAENGVAGRAEAVL